MNEKDLIQWLRDNPDLSIDVKATAVQPQSLYQPQIVPQETPQSKEAETMNLLLQQIAFVGLPEPRLQYQFGPTHVYKNGHYRADLAWPEHMLICEIDGGIWLKTKGGYSSGHCYPPTYKKDRIRDRWCELNDWHVLRFVTEEVMNEAAVTDLMQWFEKFAEWGHE